MAEKLYCGYNKDELENLYNQKHRIPNYEDYPINWKRDSDRARKELETKMDVRYGDHSLETYDVFVGNPGSPVHVFFHGGYWYSQDKSNFEFMAPAFVDKGWTFVGANYPLCPNVTMTELIHSCRKMVLDIFSRLNTWGFDGSAIHLAGHSAGAQIVSILATTEWDRHTQNQHPLISRTMGISGIYDLQPVIYIDRNLEIGLTNDDVSEFSPMYSSEPFVGELMLAVGTHEGSEKVRQMQDYAKKQGGRGKGSQSALIENANHFSILDHYADRDGVLFKLATEK
ncbi:MAG: alpha/beta hydrolase [Pseudomonadota bacterium]|nr:alpha/beta hydrolase [Pseudomonadota bacterium]|tara:strand:- start:1400 stop:2251 length:852 start_codon:yes stop_codon:yes gene_type:complete